MKKVPRNIRGTITNELAAVGNRSTIVQQSMCILSFGARSKRVRMYSLRWPRKDVRTYGTQRRKKRSIRLSFGGRGNRFTVSGSGARARRCIFAEGREGRRDCILYLHPWKLHFAQARTTKGR